MNKIMKALSMMFAMGAMLVGNGINNVETKVAKAEAVTISLTDKGYANAEDVTTITTSPISIIADKGTGSNAPKYYTSGTAVRMYKGNTLTFSITDSSVIEINNITLTCTGSSNTIKNDEVTVNNGTNVSSNSTSVITPINKSDSVSFTVGATQVRIKSINVDYTIDENAASAKLTSIKIDSDQSKNQYYVNESLNISDIYLVGEYDNGTSKRIADGYTSNPEIGYTFTNEDIGDSKTITVNYEEFNSVTYTVKVVADAAKSIYWNNWYVPCVIGSAFDLGDSTFEAVYLSGLEKTVEASEISFKLGDETIEPGYIFKSEDNGKVLTYSFEEASYTKTINLYEPSSYTNADFTLVKDINDLAAGDKIVIANAKYGKALSFVQNTNNRGEIAVTINGDVLTAPGAIEVITVENGSTDGTYALATDTGYLYAAGGTASNNYLKTTDTLDSVSSWNISITDEGIASIQSADSSVARNTLRYNDFNGIYSCYAATSQNDVSIYKLSATAELKSLIADVTSVDTCKDYDQYDALKARYDALSEEEKAIFDATKVGDYTLAHKLSYMGELAKVNQDPSNTNTNLFTSLGNNNVSYVLIIGVLGLVAIAAYYFLNKKKVSC